MQLVEPHNRLEGCSKGHGLLSTSASVSGIHDAHKGFPDAHQELQPLLLLGARQPGIR